MSEFELPESAVERIQEAKKGSFLFSGEFSPADLLLLKQAEFMPVGLVFGASVMNVGYVYNSYSLSNNGMGGFDGTGAFTNAYQEAIENALGRLEKEATDLGADGVMGVKISVSGTGAGDGGSHTVPEGAIEVKMFGTAVKYSGVGIMKNKAGLPFVTEMNAGQFCGLLRTHYVPTGLAFGVSVHTLYLRVQGQSWHAFEETGASATINQCRRDCQDSAESWAAQYGSSGIVDFKVSLNWQPYGDSQTVGQLYFMYALCFGTCVRPFKLPSLHPALAAGEKIVVPLN